MAASARWYCDIVTVVYLLPWSVWLVYWCLSLITAFIVVRMNCYLGYILYFVHNVWILTGNICVGWFPTVPKKLLQVSHRLALNVARSRLRKGLISCTSTCLRGVCSLCTTLSVEWEPDLIAISLLYLSCRLMKFKVESWVDKPSGYTGKWYKFFLGDVNLDIIESM